MKNRFYSKQRKNKNYHKIILVLALSLLLIINYNNNVKRITLSSLLSYTTNKDDPIIEVIKDNLINPKNVLYYSLNNGISKKELSVFKDYNIDEYNYNEEKSDFVLIDDNKEDNPIIYIYNTHQTEEYEKDNFVFSVKPNVMIASYIFKEQLKKYNINSIIENRSMKEYLVNNGLTYNDSYHASEYYARTALKDNPTIKYMIDIHRDSINKELSSITIDGKPYTKVMFLMGYEHSKYENNDGFAEKLNEIIESKYKGISRGVIDYRSYYYESYNPDLNTISTLIEVGGVESNIEEINNTLEALAWTFNEYLKGVNNE